MLKLFSFCTTPSLLPVVTGYTLHLKKVLLYRFFPVLQLPCQEILLVLLQALHPSLYPQKHIYSIPIEALSKIANTLERPPGLSVTAMAITFVILTVNPFSLSIRSASSGLLTIKRKIPKSVVSAMDKASHGSQLITILSGDICYDG